MGPYTIKQYDVSNV